MSDDLKQRGGTDRQRINVNQDYELRDWARRLGVSEQELKEAVRAVGDRVDQVRDHLAGTRGGSDAH
jgi:transposase-like protein